MSGRLLRCRRCPRLVQVVGDRPGVISELGAGSPPVMLARRRGRIGPRAACRGRGGFRVRGRDVQINRVAGGRRYVLGGLGRADRAAGRARGVGAGACAGAASARQRSRRLPSMTMSSPPLTSPSTTTTSLHLGHKPSSGPSSGRRATRRGQQHGSGEVDDPDGGKRRDVALRHGPVPSPRRATDHWSRTTILAPNLPMRSSKC